MNTTLDDILTRRSIRKFKQELPDRESLEKIIEAGLYAASGHGMQSSMIVAVTDKGLRDRLMEMNRLIGGWQEGFDPFYGAPAVLVVLSNRESPNHVYDGSLTMGNMMLAAHALGLGSCWVHVNGRLRDHKDPSKGLAEDYVRDLLGLKEAFKPLCIVALGYEA
jgi:nitroreductase